MSRYIVCDVCDNNYELDHVTAQVAMPTAWIPGAEPGDEVLIDVCSTECLASMAIRVDQGRMPGDNQDEIAPVSGETADQGDDEVEPRYAPEEPVHVDTGFLSPVKVKSKGER